MKSYVIHLIRNAPSVGNLQGRYIGRTDSPIADEGISRLLELKQKHGYPEASAFYASPSTRCVDTLKILYPQAEPEVILEMAECDFGDFENKTAKELENDHVFTKWIENGGQTAPPNGESGSYVLQRTCAGFEMLVNNMIHKGDTSNILVTHSMAITSILAVYGLPKANAYDWMCESCCGYSVRITPSLWMRSKVIEVFDMIPQGLDKSSREHYVIDLAREAANKAFGNDKNE